MFMRPMSSESRRQPLMMMPCQPFLVPMSAAARALALVDKGLQPRGTSGCWASTAVAWPQLLSSSTSSGGQGPATQFVNSLCPYFPRVWPA